ncbi:MAG: DUF6931 family protein [Gemmatirosa sp.]
MSHATHASHAAPAPGATLAPPSPPSGLVRWLCERAAFTDEALLTLAARAADPDALVAALADAGKHPEAVRLVAVALPKREAIWWAWVSARHAAQAAVEQAAQQPTPPATGPATQPTTQPAAAPPPPPPAGVPPAVQHALAAVERWITHPDDANRRTAFAAAQAATAETPVGCAGFAVFFSGGSLAAPEVPFVVPPPPGACWQLVAGAITLAAMQGPPAHMPTRFAGHLAQGVEIVRRLGGWEPAATLARQAYDHDVQASAHATAQAKSPPPAAPPTA